MYSGFKERRKHFRPVYLDYIYFYFLFKWFARSNVIVNKCVNAKFMDLTTYDYGKL